MPTSCLVKRTVTTLSATAAAITSTSSNAGARQAFASPRTRCFHFADQARHLAVETNDPWTARILQSAFALMRCAPIESECHAHIARSGSELVMRFDSCALTFSITALGSFGAALAGIREIFARFAAGNANATAIYGGSAAFRNAGVVFLGASGIGKTILLLHLLQRGLRFLGDETVLVNWESGNIEAQPRLPALREAGLAFLPSDDLRNAVLTSPHVVHMPGRRYWYALEPEHLRGTRPDATPHPLRAIVHLQGRAAQPRITELRHDDVLQLVSARSYFKPASLHELARIRRSLSHVRAFSLLAGEPANTADALVETLQCA